MTKRREREDLPGLQHQDVVIKTELSGFFKNEQQRRQLQQVIQKDATDVSKCFVLFSRFLHNQCFGNRYNDDYFKTLGKRNGIRSAFTRFMEDPNIAERQGIELTDFNGMVKFRNGCASSYEVAVRENLKQNMRRRFILFYELIRGEL